MDYILKLTSDGLIGNFCSFLVVHKIIVSGNDGILSIDAVR